MCIVCSDTSVFVCTIIDVYSTLLWSMLHTLRELPWLSLFLVWACVVLAREVCVPSHVSLSFPAVVAPWQLESVECCVFTLL